ncbi:MAG TPA: HAMP domain-containing sensor histidine kinase [Polyangiaceae bacterium]|nr:HAMP domain-containing sensor histidine kinase [Polyangiaceae bacterium]
MKLVPKLALALFAGVFAVVAGFTAWRVHREIELFDQDARRDQRVVGTTAGAALSRHRTLEDAVRLARRVDASRESIRIRYVSMLEHAPADLRPLVKLRESELPSPGKWLQIVKPRTPDVEKADVLLTYVAAPVEEDLRGAIELSQPLASRTEYAWRGVWSALASSLAMLLAGGLISAVIGARVVGQPVAELITAARRIGEGDFNVLQSTRRQDELGELARAMRTMSLDLAAARHRATEEAGARIRALEQLRHAERLSTLGQLASVLAHEIGTPLNVIAGHGKLIEAGRLDGEATRESAATIRGQCERITGIVRRILDYARRSPAKRFCIEAPDVLAQTRAMLSSLAEQQSIELIAAAPPAGLELDADPGQLQQALTNVVMNAIHASPSGGKVELGVEVEEAAGEAGAAERVVFKVHNEGEAIPEEIRQRIFEPFFTTKAPGEGTGLGLSVARDIVAEHGGFIDVLSPPAGGTTFKISLPRRNADAGASARRR